jgi:hypothetical protein
MLFRETNAVYYENHAKHTNKLCGQNPQFYFVKAGGAYSNHWALNGGNQETLKHLRIRQQFRNICIMEIISRLLQRL